jgi:hypothetical protein
MSHPVPPLTGPFAPPEDVRPPAWMATRLVPPLFGVSLILSVLSAQLSTDGRLDSLAALRNGPGVVVEIDDRSVTPESPSGNDDMSEQGPGAEELDGSTTTAVPATPITVSVPSPTTMPPPDVPTSGAPTGSPGSSTPAPTTPTATISPPTTPSGPLDLSVKPAAALFHLSDFIPGSSATRMLRAHNAGTGKLIYALSASADDTDGKSLRSQLRVTIRAVDRSGVISCDAFNGTLLYDAIGLGVTTPLVGSSLSGYQSGDRLIGPNSSDVLCIRFTLPIDTPNQFQGAVTNISFVTDAEAFGR